MPIRINLLAEAQALEEMRRRDPAKRAIWVSAVLLAVILGWSSLLWMKIWAVSSTLNNRALETKDLAKTYDVVRDNQKKLWDAQAKLAALGNFTSNRFLQANVLDNLMHLPPDVIHSVQVVRLRTEQSFEVTAATKPGTTESGKPVPGKPGSTTEKVTLYLDAKDSSANPGDEQITKYIEALAATPYFVAQHITTNNIQMRITGNLQVDADTGKPFIPFALECALPKRVH
jgi:hypothetical protein